MHSTFLILLSTVALAWGQQAGSVQTETYVFLFIMIFLEIWINCVRHPSLRWSECTAKGRCTQKNGKWVVPFKVHIKLNLTLGRVVLDANWRWTREAKSGSYKNCYTGNEWDATLCPDNTACAKNCALEGADYAKTYGVQVSGDQLSITARLSFSQIAASMF